MHAGTSLHAYLTRIIWICVLPLLVLLAYLAVDSVRTTQSETDVQAANLARNFANAVDQDLHARIGALATLANSPLADHEGDWPKLYIEALGVRQSLGGDVILANLQRQMLFNTRVPYGTALPLLPQEPTGRKAAAVAAATGVASVSNIVQGPVAKEPLVAVVVPGMRDGKASFVVIATNELRGFQQRIDQVALTSDWTLALEDGSGETIARRGARSGESDRRYVVRSTVAPWSVVLTIPRDVYQAPLMEAAARLAVAILFAVLVAFVGARWASRRLAVSVAGLVEPRTPDTPASDIAEIASVRRLLDETLDRRDAADRALRDSEKRFRATFEQAAVGMALVGLEGRCLRVNRRLCAIVGYSDVELLDKTFQELTHPDDRAASASVVKAMLAGAIDTHESELRYVRKDGNAVWVTVSVAILRDEDGNPHNFVSSIQEIQGRKEAEAAIAERESALNEAQRLAKLGSWKWDLVTDRYFRSTEAIRILGLDPDRPATTFSELQHAFTPDSSAQLAATVQRAVAEGGSYEFDAELATSDGLRRWVTLRGDATRDAGGSVVELHGTIQDITARKNSEALILDTKNQLRATLDALPDLMFETDVEGRIYSYHTPRDELLAAAPGAILGKNFSDVLPPDVAAVCHAALQDAERTGGSSGMSYALELPQGRRWFELSISTKPGVDGAGARFIVLARDITLRRRAQDALEASERRFRGLIENASDLVFMIAADGVLKYVSPSSQLVAGYAPAEVLGRNIMEFTHPADVPTAGIALSSVLAAPQALSRATIRLLHKDGRTVVLESTARNCLGDPALQGIVINAHDVTENQRIAEELRQHRAQLEVLVAQRTSDLQESNRKLLDTQFAMERVGIGIHWVDFDTGRFLLVNSHAAAMLGYSVAEMLGLSIWDIDPNFPSAEFKKAFESLRRRRSSQFESVNRTKDGRMLPVEVTLYYLPGAESAAGRFIVFITDISKRKEAERQLVRARDTAEAGTRAKSAFLANMSHEIRTPMSGILGMAHLMRQDGVTPLQADRLGKIEQSGRHLLDLINDILDLAKIEAGMMHLDIREFTLPELLDGIGAMVGTAVRSKGLALRIDVAGMPLRLCGDATRLRQALLNYLGNAIKFTPHGGITLSGRVLEETDSGYLLRFAVTDTGIGIAEEARARLFAPFQQGDESTTRVAGGTGLGLSITREIAQLMGGEVGVDSVPGQGSTFWLTVRLGRSVQGSDGPAVPAAEVAESVLRRDHHGRRVLVAEDDPINQEVALELLREAGLTADLAANGEEAVRLAQATDYAVILMDVQMPRVDGLDATRAIRALPDRADTPIIAMTANAFVEDRRTCLAAGMNDFLAKPVDPNALYAMLMRWLGAPKLPATPGRPSND